MHRLLSSIVAFAASALVAVQAQGIAPAPALEGFTADPSIRVFGDTYYLYPTSDRPNWMTTDFSVWSSKDLVKWKKERMVLDVANDLKWANIKAWAPDAIERNGTYYFYFSADHKIGVATAKSPTGPFIDALGAPLLVRTAQMTTNTIDPYPFIDDDGQAYLYWGNGDEANAYKLKPDMVTVEGEVHRIPMKDFREGVVVFKRQGKYYFMWSIDDARSPNYRVGWGTADSPLGPVKAATKNFIVLQKNGAAVGTAHHSVVQVPGTDRWYVAYHRHAIPDGNGYQRQTVLAKMTFDADGNILPMDPMQPAFQPGDVGEPIVDGKGLSASVPADRPNYLLAHFTSETTDGEQIYFATSQDGYRWTDLNGSKPVLRSTIGEQGVRDPAIVRSPRGDKFWILATDLRIASGKGWQAAMHKGSTKLMIWESTNLVDWSAPRLVDVAGAIPGAGNAWAPEAIYDESSGDYLVYWATISPAGGVTKPRIYYSRTRDFVSFTPATLYIDRPGTHGLIDTQIVKVDDPRSRYRYVRASGDGQLTLEGANALLDQWDILGDLRPLGLTGKDVEGPILFRIAQTGEWAMWVDQYARKAGYLALTSDDLSRPERFRRAEPDRIDYGRSKKRHGSILDISSDEYRRLLARWPVAAPAQASPP